MISRRTFQVSAAILSGLALLRLAAWLPTLPRTQSFLYLWLRATAVGSAALLQVFRIRIWADGILLRTDLHTYILAEGYHGIPVTTFALLLASMLAWSHHLRWRKSLALAFAAVTLGFTGNILRVALITQSGPAPQTTAMPAILRDSTLILGVVIAAMVYLTVFLLEALGHLRHQQRERHPGAVSGALSEFPPFWHRVFRRHRTLYILPPLLALALLLAYALRPARRAWLLTGLVADMSTQGAYDQALRLGRHLSATQPHDIRLQVILIRTMLLAGQPDAATAAMDHLDLSAHPERADDIALFTAHARILQQDWPAARLAFQKLQHIADKDPLWSTILLELATMLGDQESMRAYAPEVAYASSEIRRWKPLLPLLASSGDWVTLLAATRTLPLPQVSLEILRYMIIADLQQGHTDSAAERVQVALQRNPDDQGLLLPLLVLAGTNPVAWEPRLADHLAYMTKGTQDPAALSHILNVAFSINRPDLAWPAYRKLLAVAPDTVFPLLARTTHTGHWFRFRKHHLTMPAESPAATIDLLPFIILARHIPSLQQTIAKIPHANDLHHQPTHEPDTLPATETEALKILAARAGELQEHPGLLLQIAMLLENAGEPEQAIQILASLQEQHPAWEPIVRYPLARLELRSGDTRQAYGNLQNLFGETPPLSTEHALNPEDHWPPQPIPRNQQSAYQLPLALALIEQQWDNRQWIAALFTAREAHRRFPHDPAIRTILATLLLQMQRPEQALVLLENTRIRRLPASDRLEAVALQATGRSSVMQDFRRQRLLEPVSTSPSESPERLAPAEQLLAPHHQDELLAPDPAPGSTIARLLTALDSAEPPDFMTWWSDARSRLEQAEALHMLTRHMLGQGRNHEARQAAQLAVMANPHEPLLWIDLLRLHPEPWAIITHARSFCPDDPDLWLAELVLLARDTTSTNKQAARTRHIAQGMAMAEMPVDILVRAADFLWRGQAFEKAARLVNHYHGRERGLLAAHLLGVAVAGRQAQPGRTLYHIQAGIAASVNPRPALFATFLQDRIQQGQTESDSNVINALRQLRQADPENPIWPEWMGLTRFTRGGADILEAGIDMQAAIHAGSTNAIAYLIAAEAHRRINRITDAADILRQGLDHHPTDPVLLNNLAYTLAEDPATAAKAMTLAPRLQVHAARNPEIRDTLAFVYLRNGDTEAARELLARNLQELSPDSRTWFRSQMHLAEILWRQGRAQVATSMLDQLLRGARNIPDEDILSANRLLMRISTAPFER